MSRVPSTRLVLRGAIVHARDHRWMGLHVTWRGVVHYAHGIIRDKNNVFRTLCGEEFAVTTSPHVRVITCLSCIGAEEDIPW
jgi:hypothetical protein